jgi:hypothetical protein
VLSFSGDNNTYVTGNTSTTSATDSTNQYSTELTYLGVALGAPHSLDLEDTFVTGGTITGNDLILHKNDGTQTSPIDLSDFEDTYVTGGTVSVSATDSSNSAIIGLFYRNSDGSPYLLPFEDTFVTGGTLSNNDLILTRNDGTNLPSIDLSALDTVDTFVTGFTWTEGTNTLTISRNQGQSDLDVVVDSFTGPIQVNGDFTVTGGTLTACDIMPTKTWNDSGGCDIGAPGSRFRRIYSRSLWLGTSTTQLDDDGSDFTISGNTGDFIFRPANDGVFHADFLPGTDLGYNLGDPLQRWNTLYAGNISATGITIGGLGAGRVVYTDGSGGLTTEAGFEYSEVNDRLTVGDLAVNNALGNSVVIGQGGMVIGSAGDGNLVVHGDLTVLGDTTTVSTSELYIEDPSITINYNPTGSTTTASIGAGMIIQDGSGIVSTDSNFLIGQLFLNGNINSNSEYTAATGNANRGWFTDLNDILIRNTNGNSGAPDGKRVLAEDDCLDAGQY